MKKIIAPKLKPIEFEITDLDGKKHEFRIDTVSLDIMEKLEEVYIKESGSKDRLTKQMVILFGGKDADYTNYDVRVLNAAMDHISEEIKNPF